MKILNLLLGRYFDKQILKRNKFGLSQEEFRQKRKMSEFEVKKKPQCFKKLKVRKSCKLTVLNSASMYM